MGIARPTLRTIHRSQGWALRATDGTIEPFPQAADLTMSVRVLPCAPSTLGLDGGGDAGDAAWVDAGSGCVLSYPSTVCAESGAFWIEGRCANPTLASWSGVFVAPVPMELAPWGYENSGFGSN